MTSSSPTRAGAYGLTVRGLDDPVAAGLNPLPDAGARGDADGVDWPDVTIVRRLWEGGDDDLPATEVGDDRAILRLLGGGYLEIDRASATATFHLMSLGTERDVAHPLLAPVGAVLARWQGRETFHCAGFTNGGAAWALAADKEAGKSTLAAQLALRGVPLLADDLLVLDHGLDLCLAGPRLVDLRRPTADHLRDEHGVELVDVRGGDRARLELEPVPLVSPFRGFVLLVEGEGPPAVRTVPVAERMERLAVHRGIRLEPADPTVLLDLATRPVLELSRPKRFDEVDAVIELLLEATAGAVQAGSVPRA